MPRMAVANMKNVAA
uniref:Uncharacterized protein n=1 Tax=Arundo donax TaxID=35708 RepID=A0A0A8ZJ79_ARUDO